MALANIARSELRDPFLQDTLRRVPSELTLAHVPNPEATSASVASAPAGLVFHVARCGSTLVSQLLKLQPGLTVYSEPPAINELLAPPHGASRARLIGALRAVGEFFSRHANGPYVLKLSSWNVLFCDVLAEAFPQSPWVLCVRDPLEVCVSLHTQPPGWLKGGEASPLHGHLHAAGDPFEAIPERRVAQAFAAFCTAAERLDPARGRLLSYDALPQAVWTEVLPAFGMQADESAMQRMLAASQSHAKAPVGQTAPFAGDAQRKRMAASPELRNNVDAIARPALDRLMARMRREQAC